jgi:hypothetical protein
MFSSDCAQRQLPTSSDVAFSIHGPKYLAGMELRTGRLACDWVLQERWFEACLYK